jgi:hypothetical protein
MKKEEQETIRTPKSQLNSLVDAALAIEKLRVAAEIRESHLVLQGRPDPETVELIKRLNGVEEYVDGRVALFIVSHPAFHWFSRVKGVGKENIGKVVGLVDITKAPTPSSLWKFAGMAVVDGHSPRPVKGEKLAYNAELRSMCWRLAGSLMKASGKYYQYYLEQKERYTQRFDNAGVHIVSSASLLTKDGKKYESEGTISAGHVHNMALRKMIKLFLSHLWVVWREAEGLPVTKPYAIDQLGHDSYIDPWSFVDREAIVKKKPGRKKRAMID